MTVDISTSAPGGAPAGAAVRALLAARVVLGAFILAVIATVTFTATPASAGIQWDAPPTCFKGSQWHYHNYWDPSRRLLGLYSFTYERAEKVATRGGYETRYYWMYTVEAPTSRGMAYVGWSRKLCGSRWTPGF